MFFKANRKSRIIDEVLYQKVPIGLFILSNLASRVMSWVGAAIRAGPAHLGPPLYTHIIRAMLARLAFEKQAEFQGLPHINLGSRVRGPASYPTFYD